jgi:hypothetical protein
MDSPTPPEFAPDSLAARFTQRLIERDAPPPPPSQEPAAVLARVDAWLLTAHRVPGWRLRRRLARIVVGLMETPEFDTSALTAAAGVGWRAASRMGLQLLTLGIIVREQRGRHFYHRLSRAAEDALLLVVTGSAGR